MQENHQALLKIYLKNGGVFYGRNDSYEEMTEVKYHV